MSRVDLNLDAIGVVPASFIRAMAAEKRIDISGIFAPHGGYAFADEAGFHALRAAVASVPTRPEDWLRLVHAVLEESAVNDLIYGEIRMEPASANNDVPAWRERLLAVREAVSQGEAQGITLRVTASCLRQHGPASSRAGAICAAEVADDLLTGFALTGDEGVGVARDHAWAFDCAREAGLGLTADVTGPQAVRDALRDLRIDRIGGGAGVIDDLALVDELAEAGTVLALYPAEDIAFGRHRNWRGHPAGQLYHRGVRLALGSGASAFTGAGLRAICHRLHDAFDWDDGVFRTLAQTGLSAAFCDAATRDRIQKRLT